MKTLTKAEEQVMQSIWNINGGFLKDIVEIMPEPKPHSNTVATIIKILVEKNFVNFEVQGRNNLYRPVITKQQYANASMNTIMSNYFDGSATRLVSHFIKNEEVSVEELEQMLVALKSNQNDRI